MIQRRTWKDMSNSIGAGKEGVELPDHEGVMLDGNAPETVTVMVGTMAFRGMSYQFSGLDPAQVGEAAARWIQQNTGRDEVEQLTLVVKDGSRFRQYILTKVDAAVVVSYSAYMPKVYR